MESFCSAPPAAKGRCQACLGFCERFENQGQSWWSAAEGFGSSALDGRRWLEFCSVWHSWKSTYLPVLPLTQKYKPHFQLQILKSCISPAVGNVAEETEETPLLLLWRYTLSEDFRRKGLWPFQKASFLFFKNIYILECPLWAAHMAAEG